MTRVNLLPPPLVPDLKTVCAWCGVLIREGAEPVSHGICRPCAATWSAEYLPPAPKAPERLAKQEEDR